MRARVGLVAGVLAMLAVGVGLIVPADAADPAARYRVELKGRQEVDADGARANPHGNDDRGLIILSLRHDTVKNSISNLCWNLKGIVLYPGDDLPSMGHIHRAIKGKNGDIMVTLFGPGAMSSPEEFPTGVHCTEIGRGLAENMIDHPDRFYVNLHNTQHPGGAMRAQLMLPAA